MSVNNYNICSDFNSKFNFIEEIVPLEKAKKELEEKLITMAYEKYKSSYKVAEILNISQATAYRKIKQYILNKSE